MLPKIRSAAPLEDSRLHLTYAHGEEVVVDLSEVIQQGGIMGPLADPDFFGQVAVSEDGRYITWPGELDLCADALLREGQPIQPAERPIPTR